MEQIVQTKSETVESIKQYNIRLRPAEATDLDTIFTWRKLPEIKHWFPFYSDTALKVYYEVFLTLRNVQLDYLFIIEETSVIKEPIGTIAISNIYFKTQMADISDLMIGHAEAQGKGLALHALKLAVWYAFEILNLKTLRILVDTNNIKAISLYNKVGFHISYANPERKFHTMFLFNNTTSS